MNPRAVARLAALIHKEVLQILRDPSTLLISFLFPAVLMLVFGSGISMDSNIVRLGIFDQDGSPAARRLVETYRRTPGFRLTEATSVAELSAELRAGELQGFVVIDREFGKRMLTSPGDRPLVQVITDGSEPNGANFVAAYAQGAFGVWSREELAQRGYGPDSPSRSFSLETRAWFNPSTVSRNSLLPGSLTLIMMVVGALLTALVIAREWERGTMEALLAVGISRFELIVSKLVPYFVLGQLAFTICVLMTHFFFEVPLRGSLGTLYFVASTFLLSALGMGLLISTTLKNQFNAAQMALNVSLLPAMMLSGFVFEVRSMPVPIQVVASVIPARYFVTAMQTLFQAGDVWSVLTKALIGLTLASVGFLGLTFLATRRRLE